MGACGDGVSRHAVTPRPAPWGFPTLVKSGRFSEQPGLFTAVREESRPGARFGQPDRLQRGRQRGRELWRPALSQVRRDHQSRPRPGDRPRLGEIVEIGSRTPDPPGRDRRRRGRHRQSGLSSSDRRRPSRVRHAHARGPHHRDSRPVLPRRHPVARGLSRKGSPQGAHAAQGVPFPWPYRRFSWLSRVICCVCMIDMYSDYMLSIVA